MLCVSGHVQPSPACSSCRWGSRSTRIINDVCGGVWKGRKVKGGHPGRRLDAVPSTPTSFDVPCEFDALQTDERIKP